MQALFDIILPVFVVIGFGYLVAWKGLFSESAVDGLVKFTQSFAIPCLLFRAIANIDLGAAISAPLLISYYTGSVVCFVLGFYGARLLFNRSAVDAIAIAFCCFFSNSVLLGLPITERAFGPDALAGNFAIIAFHAPLCYLLGVSAMEIARSETAKTRDRVVRVLNAMFRNPFVIAIALGLVANISELPLPGPLTSGIDLMADAALPAALFSLGGVLFQYRPEGDLRTIAMICAISLMVHPAVAWLCGTAFALDRDAFRSAIMTATMAPGVNAYVFANMYGAARRVVASSVLVATALSTLSIWLWLLILP
jgi:predicted permease